MERDTQTSLVERRTNGVRITQAGQTLIEAAERIELDVASAFRDIAPAAAR
jgi:DNA-binding transcriptional LysR family regulator